MTAEQLAETHPEAYKAGKQARSNGMRRVPGPSYFGATFHAWLAGFDADPMESMADGEGLE